MKNVFYIICVFFALGSCQKVIDIPVNDAEKILVIEAVLKDSPNASYVLVSRTGSVYDNSGFDKISDATVVISDDLGGSYTFVADPLQAGRYVLPTFKVQENRSYHLSILAGGETITADASSRTKPIIDSLTYEYEDFGIPEYGFYLVSYHSVDNALEKNHYRLKMWVNNEEVDVYFLGDDEFINGQYYNAQFFGADTDLGDTVVVELIEMDEHVYDYVSGLSSEAESNAFSPTPANPLSNLEGNAIGYFGVYMIDTDTLILQ